MNKILERFKKQVQKTSLYKLTPEQKIEQLNRILKERGKSKIPYQYKVEEFQRLKEKR